MQQRQVLGAHLTGMLLPLVMLLMSGPVVSSDGPSLAGIAIPGIGVFVTMLAQRALFINTLLEGEK